VLSAADVLDGVMVDVLAIARGSVPDTGPAVVRRVLAGWFGQDVDLGVRFWYATRGPSSRPVRVYLVLLAGTELVATWDGSGQVSFHARYAPSGTQWAAGAEVSGLEDLAEVRVQQARYRRTVLYKARAYLGL
jgi:hypothetical protein